MVLISSEQSIIAIVDQISQMHKRFSEAWISSQKSSNVYNLKRKQIRHVCDTKGVELEFIKYINDYCDLLIEVQLDDAYDTLSEHIEITSRIKNPDSRMSKILHYRHNKQELGAVNINKCLNDLLGFRIWMDDFEHSDEMVCKLNNLLEKYDVKVHNSSKNNYKATHIYFSSGDNKYFPWELQIWNRADHYTNDESHAEHKQDYTKWPGIYKDSQNMKEEEKECTNIS